MYTVELRDNKTQIIIRERNFINYNDAYRMVTDLAKKWDLDISNNSYNMYENSEICLAITQK